jgi:hypothetical protein
VTLFLRHERRSLSLRWTASEVVMIAPRVLLRCFRLPEACGNAYPNVGVEKKIRQATLTCRVTMEA